MIEIAKNSEQVMTDIERNGHGAVMIWLNEEIRCHFFKKSDVYVYFSRRIYAPEVMLPTALHEQADDHRLVRYVAIAHKLQRPNYKFELPPSGTSRYNY